MASWVPLESDPEYGHALGMKSNFEFVDVLSFDLETMGAMVPEIYQTEAIILLYPLTDSSKDTKGSPDMTDKGYFTKQTVENACGTIALIHALANEPSLVEEKSFVAKFVEETRNSTPEERAKMVESSDKICTLHASFSAQGQTDAPDASVDVNLHFVAFVKGKDGHVYELDGRQLGPIAHRQVSDEPGAFFGACSDAIQKEYTEKSSDLSFTALALVPSISYLS